MALHWKILIGMVLGIVFSFILLSTSWGSETVILKEISASQEIVQEVVNGEVVSSVKIIEAKVVETTRAEYFISRWIKPFGTIFINLLKLIAVPLILASLIKGVSDLKEYCQNQKNGIAHHCNLCDHNISSNYNRIRNCKYGKTWCWNAARNY